MKFFNTYDVSKEPQIQRLQKRIDNIKRYNSKVKTTQAQEVSDRSEVENLFLECVDESKKEVVKRKQNDMIHSKFNFTMEIHNNESVSGEERTVEQVVTNKDVLLGVFELMFGVGGYAGQNLEHQIRKKKHSLVNPEIANITVPIVDNTSFFSNNNIDTSMQSNVAEYEKLVQIMNAPIESLINMSKSQSKVRLYTRQGGKRPLTVRPDKRASTAIGRPPLNNYQSLNNYNSAYTGIPIGNAMADRSQTAQSQNLNPNIASEFRRALV